MKKAIRENKLMLRLEVEEKYHTFVESPCLIDSGAIIDLPKLNLCSRRRVAIIQVDVVLRTRNNYSKGEKLVFSGP